MSERIEVPNDLSGMDNSPVFQVHELAYDEIEVFNNEFRLACYHLEKFAESIRGSIHRDVSDEYQSSMIHLDFGVADAFIQLQHGGARKWRMQIDMHRPDVAGRE